MCDLKVCRICLRTECKFFKSDQVPLKYYYEEIMGFKSKEETKLPQYFCYECATILHKFHKFKEKCFNGQNILHDLIYRNALNYEEVQRLYKNSRSQPIPYQINIDIMKISQRVKTYHYQHFDEDDYEEEVEIEIDDTTNLGNNDYDLDVTNVEDHNFISNIDNKHQNFNNDNNIETMDKPTNLDNHNFISNEVNEQQNFNNDVNIHTDDECEDDCVDDDFTLNDKPKETQKNAISSDDELLSAKVEKKSNELKKDVTEPSKKVMKFQREKDPPKLSNGNWKKVILSDEEALQKFEAKAFDNKYLSAPYKCTECYRWFSKEDILKRHNLLRHKQSLPFGCRFCKMRFRRNFQLQTHLKQHYNLFECQLCYVICPLESSAIIHDETHSGRIRECNVCHKEFRHSSTYYSHMTMHRTNFICTICGRSFVSELGLSVHKKRTHVDQAEKPDQSESETMYCKRCDIKFEARAAYEEHLFHSANHTGDIVDINNDLQKFQKKVRGIKEKAVLAEEILKRKDGDPVLSKAVTCNRTQRKIPTDCLRCGKHFESQMQCRKHHLKEHPRTTFEYSGAPERMICEICGADLAFGSAMAHLNMHSREKLYKCEICERTFVQNASRKRHMLVHTGERAFPCTMCEKRFTQAGSRALHIRTVHLKQPYPKRNRRKKKEFSFEEEHASD